MRLACRRARNPTPQQRALSADSPSPGLHCSNAVEWPRTRGRGKYATAEYELPHDDAASQDAIFSRKFEGPYDQPPSRAPSPALPQQGPYCD
ncbi:hypothetical protein AURDEDRAFT_169974 [Auricularia subglabra TFB-10046 SS5]|uniref:Uncharacterized protein n=1 Tax=Auricularia subglabra (strain TFB-10046 / SS5) TaxID=717982 RepID=J0LK22_AURST|nr:hypothetical protein AURDEDRAFT_169974 [Auricularia subglabra TFB-10046 SS5]